MADETATLALGIEIASQLKPGDVVALEGTLGSGKTTLSQGICRGLGIQEPVTSPTYNLISEYPGKIPVYHMDVYRLSGEEDFESTGGLEYFGGPGICLVEWSDKIPGLLPGDCIRIRLAVEGAGRRVILTGGPF